MQVGELREGLLAPGMAALVRFVAGVRPDVLLEMREMRKLPLTNLTAVGFDAQVDAGVLGQVTGIGKRLGAL